MSAEIFVTRGLFRPPEPPAGGSSLNSGHASFFAWFIERPMLAGKPYGVIMFFFCFKYYTHDLDGNSRNAAEFKASLCINAAPPHKSLVDSHSTVLVSSLCGFFHFSPQT